MMTPQCEECLELMRSGMSVRKAAAISGVSERWAWSLKRQYMSQPASIRDALMERIYALQPGEVVVEGALRMALGVSTQRWTVEVRQVSDYDPYRMLLPAVRNRNKRIVYGRLETIEKLKRSIPMWV